MRPLRLLAAALLVGCAATVSASDASVDAPAGDAATRDAPGSDARVCALGRMCTPAAFPESINAACYEPNGTVELTGGTVSLSFCRCLHGFGPGVDGSLVFWVTNQTARPIELGVSPTLTLTSVTDGRPVEIGGCCTLRVVRPYTCEGDATPWRGRVDPARTERLRVDVHVDTPETRPGRYRVGLTVPVDGAQRSIDLGEQDLPLAPVP